MDWLDHLDLLVARLVTAPGGGLPGVPLTQIADQFVGNPMLKMLPLVLLLLHGWLRSEPGAGPAAGVLASPERLVRGTLAIAVTLAAGRLLQILLPMRLRPRFAHPEIDFPPTGFAVSMDDWSSMPSDHAMLAAAILVVIALRSRRHALIGGAWALSFVCGARVYFGLHYASDILAGFLIGLVIAGLVLRMPLPQLAWSWLAWLDQRRPALVLLGLFVLAWSIGEGFSSIRGVIGTLRRAVPAEAAVLLALPVFGLGALLLTTRFLLRRTPSGRLGQHQPE